MSSLSEVERYRLERLINELKMKKGRGTELITLYVPSGRRLDEVISLLRQEYSQASNIKDRTTRHHVLDALTTVMQRLRMVGMKAPKNGLVVFCGYIDVGVPGKERLEVHLLEPPEPVKIWLYRCDSRFHTEILERMIREHDIYGLIVIDRNEAAIAVLKGVSVEILKTLTSGVPGKHRRGGQSSRRFQRIIEQRVHEFFKRVGEHANTIFLENPDLRGILIGGPGPTKEAFFKGDYLDYRLKQKVLGLVDIGYSGEEGIYELIKRGSTLLEDTRYMHERRILNKFLEYVIRKSDLVAYGEDEVRKMLTYGAVEMLILSRDLPDTLVTVECANCGAKYVIRVKSESEKLALTCNKCKGPVKILNEKPLIDDLIEKAQSQGVKIELISSQVEEGEMFRKAFGGVGAILRFNPRGHGFT